MEGHHHDEHKEQHEVSVGPQLFGPQQGNLEVRQEGQHDLNHSQHIPLGQGVQEEVSHTPEPKDSHLVVDVSLHNAGDELHQSGTIQHQLQQGHHNLNCCVVLCLPVFCSTNVVMEDDGESVLGETVTTEKAASGLVQNPGSSGTAVKGGEPALKSVENKHKVNYDLCTVPDHRVGQQYSALGWECHCLHQQEGLACKQREGRHQTPTDDSTVPVGWFRVTRESAKAKDDSFTLVLAIRSGVNKQEMVLLGCLEKSLGALTRESLDHAVEDTRCDQVDDSVDKVSTRTSQKASSAAGEQMEASEETINGSSTHNKQDDESVMVIALTMTSMEASAQALSLDSVYHTLHNQEVFPDQCVENTRSMATQTFLHGVSKAYSAVVKTFSGKSNSVRSFQQYCGVEDCHDEHHPDSQEPCQGHQSQDLLPVGEVAVAAITNLDNKEKLSQQLKYHQQHSEDDVYKVDKMDIQTVEIDEVPTLDDSEGGGSMDGRSGHQSVNLLERRGPHQLTGDNTQSKTRSSYKPIPDVSANKLETDVPVQVLGSSVSDGPVEDGGLQLVPHEDQQHGLGITVPALVAEVPEIQHYDNNRQVKFVNLTGLLLVNYVQEDLMAMEEDTEGQVGLNTLLNYGNQMKLKDAAEDPPEAEGKVETATTGNNVPLDTHGRVYVALFTPDETPNNIEVAHAVHHQDDTIDEEAKYGELEHGDHNSQGKVQGEDSQVLQVTVPHVHRGRIKLLQVPDTAINFLHDDGVLVVAVLHHGASETDAGHLHHSCHTQASCQSLKLNPINFVKFGYKTDKFTSCCELHSLPVFCSTTRVAVKVAVIVTNKGAVPDTTKELGQLGSIVHRKLSGEPATRMVIYNHKVNDICSVPGLLSVTRRRPRRGDVQLDAGGAVVRLQGRGGPCFQYGEGQLRPNKVAEEVQRVGLVRGVQPQDKDPGQQTMGLVVPHEGNDAEVQSLPSQVLAQVICCPKVNQVYDCHNCREDQDEVHCPRPDQAQLCQQDHQHYPGDAGHSLAQCGDMEITFNSFKRVSAMFKGNKLTCGTFLQPTVMVEEAEVWDHKIGGYEDTFAALIRTLGGDLVVGPLATIDYPCLLNMVQHQASGENELEEVIEEIVREAEEDPKDTDGGIDVTLSTSTTGNQQNPASQDGLVFKQNVKDSPQNWEEDNMHLVNVLGHGAEAVLLIAGEVQGMHGRQVDEGVHVDWAHTLDVLDVIDAVKPRGELGVLPPDGQELLLLDAFQAQVVPSNVQQHVAVIRQGEVGSNSDEEVQGMISQVLAIPLQLNRFLVHRNCVQQVLIPAMVFLHGHEPLHDDGGDKLQPGVDLHHQGREAGQEDAHLLSGHTRCGVLDVNSNSQASHFPYLKSSNILVNYPEDGSEIGRVVRKALLTSTGGDMVAFSVIVQGVSHDQVQGALLHPQHEPDELAGVVEGLSHDQVQGALLHPRHEPDDLVGVVEGLSHDQVQGTLLQPQLLKRVSQASVDFCLETFLQINNIEVDCDGAATNYVVTGMDMPTIHTGVLDTPINMVTVVCKSEGGSKPMDRSAGLEEQRVQASSSYDLKKPLTCYSPECGSNSNMISLLPVEGILLPHHGVAGRALLPSQVSFQTDGHGHRQEVHQPRAAHDDFGGCHLQHGSHFEGKFDKSGKDLNNYRHMYNVVSEGMIGSGVLESLPEVCPTTTNADMQYDVDKDQT